MKLAFAIWTAANLLDIITTVIGVKGLGATELNPLIVGVGFPAAMILKLFVTFAMPVYVYGAVLIVRRHAGGTIYLLEVDRLVKNLIVFSAALISGAAFWNAVQIVKGLEGA